MAFELGDAVKVVHAMNASQNGAEGIVVDPGIYGPEIKITRLPDTDPLKHNLTLNEKIGFFSSSLELIQRKVGSPIKASDVRAGDVLTVKHSTGGVSAVLKGTAAGPLTAMKRIYARAGGATLFDSNWKNSTITLDEEETPAHPLEKAEVGTRFKFEVYGSTYKLEMVKYSEKLWLREAYNNAGDLCGVEQRTNEQARGAFDKYKGKLVKLK